MGFAIIVYIFVYKLLSLYEYHYVYLYIFYLTVQHGLFYTLPMSINRPMKLHSIYSILHILL